MLYYDGTALRMGKIFRLPDHIISQIAAGEVIERPVYAVKELVENAIDAHADHIQIFIEDAGLKKIMIIDNGEGMTKEDLLECFKHHTTSKLSEMHNLLGIKSLGFRGEALSSIASVSTMIIKSRPSDEAAGTAVEINAGEVKRVYTTGMPKGTVIQVDRIFAKVPARKKFLKSPRTELRHILELVLKIAIAYPDTRFTLHHNNKLLLDFPEMTDLYQRLKKLVGQDTLRDLLPIQYAGEYVSISGFVSPPHLVTQTANKQYIFINNRPVQEKLLSQAVRKGYKGLLDSSSYPLFIVFLKVPYEMIDVNVHPKKETVILADEKNILASLEETVAATLQKQNVTTSVPLWENLPGFAANTLRDEMYSWDTPDFTRILKHAEYMQIHNLYILVQADKGTVVVDQHAAHERVLYELFLQAFKRQKRKSNQFQLKEAVVLHISAMQQQNLIEYAKVLESFGFSIEEFGHDAVKITHVPEFFKDHDVSTLINGIVDAGDVSDVNEQVDRQSYAMLRFLACRNAIKSGDPLTKKQCKLLLEELEKTPNNKTCPHGRPTKVLLPLKDFHKLFKRI